MRVRERVRKPDPANAEEVTEVSAFVDDMAPAREPLLERVFTLVLAPNTSGLVKSTEFPIALAANKEARAESSHDVADITLLVLV
jgi:hypothetical protein